MEYRNIVFLQGEEAIPIIDELNEMGSKRAMEMLFEWDYGEGEISNDEPWGSSDDLWEWNNSHDGTKYILSVNHDLDYIALTEVIE